MRLESVQVGQPQLHGSAGAADPLNQPWESAFFKAPVEGAAWVTLLGVAGDRQADTENHGGVDKAVLLYSADHYPHWRAELGMLDMPFGGFGENLTVSGQDERSVCIGDVLTIGDAEFEVSQPRQPCWKMARRWRIKTLPATVIQNGRSGWYCRVTREGQVCAGDEVALLRRPFPEWTVHAANRVMHQRVGGQEAAQRLAGVAALSAAWRGDLLRRSG